MGLALAVLALRRAVAIVSVPYFSAYSRIVLLLILYREPHKTQSFLRP